jgi:predicted Zn-ribbon and HTH transcriptional regulator
MATPTVEIRLTGFRCERCGHEWVPKDIKQEPRVCPKCKSPYWNKPRREKLVKKGEITM